MPDQQVLAAALRPRHDEGLLLEQPGLEQVHVPQHRHRGDQRREHAGPLDCLQRHVGPHGGRLVAREGAACEATVERPGRVWQVLAGPLEDLVGELAAALIGQVATNASAHGQHEFLLRQLRWGVAVRVLARDHLAEDVQHETHPGGVDGQLPLDPTSVDKVKRLVEKCVEPLLVAGLHIIGLPHDPRGDQRLDVHVLLRQEYHVQAADRGGRGEAEVVSLEDEIDVCAKLDALAVRHRQKAVIVEDAVERLNPLWIHISIAHDPVVGGHWLLDHLSRARGEHAVEPLAGVVVHVA
mmetsp:Transcript_16860/g.46912  ORF Transcript_16860/g.46912 Transcript_16860/m.46912 type:complete len:296 (+) Transcript_16860:5478-6365(+)